MKIATVLHIKNLKAQNNDFKKYFSIVYLERKKIFKNVCNIILNFYFF